MFGRIIDSITRFLRLQAAGGLVLIAATIAALLVSNSPWATGYDRLLSLPAEVRIGDLGLAKPLRLWIDDGLMAIFFLLVGLEIKREVVQGELATRAQVLLPVSAALGGMVIPAAIYAWINAGDAVALRGWAIPMATDIAFALGITSLLGKRVPASLKVLLAAIAIADDLGAILVIAFFYTENLSVLMLLLALGAIVVLITLNLLRITNIIGYAIVGLFLWVFVLKSGIHATLAGVIIAFTIPLKVQEEAREPPLMRLEHALHPWVAFGVLPVFAFANAGVDLGGGIGIRTLSHALPLGIVAGLTVGKLVGVFSASALLIKAKLAPMPEGACWTSLLGIAALCGIGFTMSLFIGTLAFEDVDESLLQGVRLGVLAASILAAAIGATLLVIASRQRSNDAVLPAQEVATK